MAEILAFPDGARVRPAPLFRRCRETGERCTVAGQPGRIERINVETGEYLVALEGRRVCIDPDKVEVAP